MLCVFSGIARYTYCFLEGFCFCFFLSVDIWDFSSLEEKSDISPIHGMLFISCIFHTLLS